MEEKETRYYSDVKELIETSNIERANELLKNGWELLTIKEEGYTKTEAGKVLGEVKPVYILGKVSTQASGHEDIETRLAQLKWTASSNGKLEYVRNAPEDLVQKIRGAKGGMRAKDYHFTAHKTDPVIFRFRRKNE